MFSINRDIWYVSFVAYNNEKLRTIEGQFSLGACDNNDKTIYICKDIPPHMIKKVLCHEITHAAMFSYGVYLTIQEEEIVADIIATYGEEIISITNSLFKQIKGETY